MLDNPALLLSLVTLVGLCVGSFLNVVIYRIPLMLQREWRLEAAQILEDEALFNEEAARPAFNLAKPDSTCPHCGHAIRAWENIPLISYIFLGGKCASCKSRISIRYPIVEAITGLLSLMIAWHFIGSAEANAQSGTQLLFALLFTWVLICLTLIDADHQLLPDSITLPLLWLGLIANSLGLFTDFHSAVIGAVAGYLVLWTVYWAFKLLTGKDGMGYGDFKLLAALGAWMGWQMLPLIIILSSLVGAVVGGVLLLRKRAEAGTAIPFGPYLAAAGWIAMLWGEQIVQAYLNFSGLAA